MGCRINRIRLSRPVLPGLLAWLMAAGALLFPFSVAASNALFGMALTVGLLSGLLWQGVTVCWQRQRGLVLAFAGYFALMLLGLLWSADVQAGFQLVGRSWIWLLVPLLVVIGREVRWRHLFLAGLSIGLLLHLGYCVMQLFGFVHVDTVGSARDDPTGLIGHIGFGFVYGIWGAWLFHLGYRWCAGWRRWGCWGAAALAYGMIFLAQGRAGQLVAAILVLVVLFRFFRAYLGLMIGAAGLVVVLVVAMAANGMLGGRWQQFADGIAQFSEVSAMDASQLRASSTGQRLYMLVVSYRVWQQQPWMGVGSGGFESSVRDYVDAHVAGVRLYFKHPHNQYMINLVRWGLFGLLATLALLAVWVSVGWRSDWSLSPAAPLLLLSAAALLVDGFFGPTFEEHFSGVMAALMLGIALASADRGDAA